MSDEKVSDVVEVKCGVIYRGGSHTVALTIENLSDEQFAWFVCEALHRVAVDALRYAAEDFNGSARVINEPESATRQ